MRRDSDDREDVLIAIENGVMPYLRKTNDALDELIAGRLQAAKSKRG